MSGQEPVNYLLSIIRPLCVRPNEIEVRYVNDDKGILIELYVDMMDLGRMIGKKGETATALRILLRALGSRTKARYSLKIQGKEIETSKEF